MLESLGRYDESIADYQAVLKVSPNDPSAWNNLGNSTALTGDYQRAVEYYGKAASLAPGFAFAAANKALAMYQLGQVDQSMRDMRYHHTKPVVAIWRLCKPLWLAQARCVGYFAPKSATWVLVVLQVPVAAVPRFR